MIQYLLFDLDNTLYSYRYGLEEDVSRRIKEYTASYLGISPEEAWALRLGNMHQYGTCLEWLVTEKGFTEIETYLAAIHPKDEAENLPADSALRAFLTGIPIPKAILTNSTREHADLILGKLGITDLFTHIFDIRQCNYMGKPRPEVYENSLQKLCLNAEDVLFIDDNRYYAAGFIAIGGNALLFDEKDIHRNCGLPRIRKLEELVQFI